ncbi:unnamed protein product [Effrenium voratum]|nr:unnamed protein product [Effrenium voratum]
MDSDLFLQRLSEQIEDCYPIGIEGTEVFSNYKNKPWEEKYYALPGFAHKYTTKKFVSRSQATFELLQVVKADQLDFDWKRAQIFDFAAGPGCAAAGVSRFLLQQNLEPHVTLLDPVREWEPATRGLREMGIEADFEFCPNLKEMLRTFKDRAGSSPGPFVICLSHVLIDFLEGNMEELWKRVVRGSSWC